MIKLVILGATLLTIAGCAESPSHNVQISNDPCLIPLENHRFILCDDLFVRVNTNTYRVPRGFKTDLASTPRLLWPLYSPTRYETIAPAVVHDYFYSCNNGLTRLQVDDIFYQSLLFKGASRVTALKYYYGVRMFGGQFYNHDDCKDEEYNAGKEPQDQTEKSTYV